MKQLELINDVYFNEDNNWKAGTILNVPADIGELTFKNIIKAGNGKVYKKKVEKKVKKEFKKN